MSKIKDLKNYIKTYTMIFDRVTKNYKLNAPVSFLYNYLDYKSKDGEMKIDFVKPNIIKILKKEKDKKVVETIKLNHNDIIASERIRVGNIKENIIRRYTEDELISLESRLTLNSGQDNETIIKIRIDKENVYVNDRDVSKLFLNDKNGIEERYQILRENYTKSKDANPIINENTNDKQKTKRQIIVEEHLREFIKEEFDYKAPLDKRDLDDLLRILNMLIKRRKTTNETSKQYKKTY